MGQPDRRSGAQTQYRTAAPPTLRCIAAQSLAKPAIDDPKTHPTNPPMANFLITEPTNSKFTERTHRPFSQPVSPLARSNRKRIDPPQIIPPTHPFPTNPGEKCPRSDPFRPAPTTPIPKITERTRALRPTARRPLDRHLLPYVIVVSIQSETSSRFTPIGYERKVSGEF